MAMTEKKSPLAQRLLPGGFGPEHVLDFGILDLGHAPSSKKVVSLVDLDVNVYGLDELWSSDRPIAAVIMSHGRCNSAKKMEKFAYGMLGELKRLNKAGSRKVTHDVIVVTLVSLEVGGFVPDYDTRPRLLVIDVRNTVLKGQNTHAEGIIKLAKTAEIRDARNHGERTKYRDRNLSFDVNPLHLIDMAATAYGVQQDYVFISTFLESYLFPKGERRIDRFIAAGISMGGHTVWRLMREDPRWTIGITSISIPPEVLGANMEERAGQFGVDPLYPRDVRAYHSAPPPPGAYVGKKILVQNGGLDVTMPLTRAAPALEAIKKAVGPNGAFEHFVDEKVGHRVSEEMVERTAEWVWRWGLTEGERAKL